MDTLVDNPEHAKAEDVNLTPTEQADAVSALDALLKEEQANGDLSVDDVSTKPDATKPEDDKHDATKPDADKPDASKPDSAKPEDKAKSEDKTKLDASKPDAEKPDATKPDAAKPDEFDKVQLPPHVKPKAAEAFEQLKTAARQKAEQLQAEANNFKSKLEETQKELEQERAKSGKLPEDISKELEELRQFKLSHDIESDPTFRTYDGKLQSNNEAIMKKLSEVSDETTFARIKEIGLENLDWSRLLDKVSLPVRRYIEAKLVENETLRESKVEALESAKKNAEQFKLKRDEREAKELTEAANAYLPKFSWTAKQKVPVNATPEQKAAIEAANAEADKYVGMVQDFLKQRGSHDAFAQLAVGTMAAHKLQSDLVALQASFESKVSELQQAVASRDKLQAELDAIKRASTSRVRDGGEVRSAPARKPVTFDVNPADALDSLAKEELSKND